MTIREWTTNYPTSLDADPITGSMPDLDDESAPGAEDGDEQRSSQVEAPRDKLQAVTKFVGSDADEAGTLRGWRKDGGSGLWKYIGLAQPSGMGTSPEALWQFDGTGSALLDRTANGHNLTAAVGSAFYQPFEGTLLGLGLRAASYYSAANNSGLILVGALTIEMLVRIAAVDATTAMTIVGCGVAGEAAADNYAYQLDVAAENAGLSYFAEEGTGTDISLTLEAMAPVGQPLHLAFTRPAATGNHKLYLNGAQVDSQSANPPTGGGSGVFRLGAWPEDGTRRLAAVIAAMKITAAEFSADQVIEAYGDTRGV